MSAAAIVLTAAGWFIGAIVAALILGRLIANGNSDRDSEQAERNPVSERPSKILLISNHGGLSK